MKILETYRPGSKRFAANLSGPYSDRNDLIFLLRHGRIRGHDSRRYLGSTDLPLDDLGRLQARWWGETFKSIRFAGVFSSRLERCLETAALAVPRQKILATSRLNEIHMGDWEGKSFGEIRQQYPKEYESRGQAMDRFRPENGENFNDVLNRIWPFFTDLELKKPGKVLVVTHAGVIRTLVSRILGIYPKGLFHIRPEYGQLYVLSFQTG